MNMLPMFYIAIALNWNSTDKAAFIIGLLIKSKAFINLTLLGK